MKVSELTDEQKQNIFDKNPSWMIEHFLKWVILNHPKYLFEKHQRLMIEQNFKWVTDNHPEIAVNIQPELMSIKYPEWMAKNRPEIMAKYNPSKLLELNIEWVADNQPILILNMKPDWMVENRLNYMLENHNSYMIQKYPHLVDIPQEIDILLNQKGGNDMSVGIVELANKYANTSRPVSKRVKPEFIAINSITELAPKDIVKLKNKITFDTKVREVDVIHAGDVEYLISEGTSYYANDWYIEKLK